MQLCWHVLGKSLAAASCYADSCWCYTVASLDGPTTALRGLLCSSLTPWTRWTCPAGGVAVAPRTRGQARFAVTLCTSQVVKHS